MRHVVGLGLLIALAASSRAGDDASAPPPAAQYDGKTAAEWTAALASDDVKLRQKAAYGLFKLGADAGAGAGALVKALHDADAYVRTTSAKAIPRLPADAVKPHVAALAADLAADSQDVRREAGSVLWRLGPLAADVVPELTKALASADEIVRANAAGCLANAGAAARPALPAVTKALDDADENVRNWATKAVVAIDPVAAFASEKTPVRLAAIQAYADPSLKGWTKPEIVTCVVKAIEDPAEDNRGWAVHALDTYAAFAGDARPVEWIAVFKKVLAASRTPGARANAAYGLGRYKGRGAEVVPVLIEAMKNREPEAQTGALIALGWLSDESRAAIPVVLPALRADDADVRRTAAYVLAAIAPAGDAAVIAALIGSTHDESQSVRSSAISSLAVVGKGSREAATEIARCLGDAAAELNTRATAARRLADVGVPDVAIPALTSAFEKDPEATPTVAVALCMLDSPHAAKALDWLVSKLGDTNPRWSVLPLLGQLGARAAPAVPAIVRVLEEPDVFRRQLAASALADIGPAAKDALPALEKAAQGADANVAAVAKNAIERIRAAPPK